MPFLGVDLDVMEQPETLTDEEILARRDCDCPSDRLGGVTESCAWCRICGQPGHACHYPGKAPWTTALCDEHYLHEARTKAMLNAHIEKRRAEAVATRRGLDAPI